MSNQQNPASISIMSDVKLDMGHMEASFTQVAAALDELPQNKWPLFLAKVALVFADRIGDSTVVQEAVDIALKDIER